MTQDTPTDRFRLVAVNLDEASIGRSSPDIDHERAVAIYDLIEENSFKPIGHDGGPYTLNLSLAENRLVFDIRLETGEPVIVHMLSLTSFKKIVKDYFMICDSYYQAIRTATPSQIMSPAISPVQKAGMPALPRLSTRASRAAIVGPGEAVARATASAKVRSAPSPGRRQQAIALPSTSSGSTRKYATLNAATIHGSTCAGVANARRPSISKNAALSRWPNASLNPLARGERSD